METKIQYNTEEERTKVISENSTKILIMDQRLFEGNFLIFSDTPTLEEQVKDLRNTVDLLLLKQEGLI